MAKKKKRRQGPGQRILVAAVAVALLAGPGVVKALEEAPAEN